MELQNLYFPPIQDIISYNCREFVSKYKDMQYVKDQNHDTSTPLQFYAKIDSDFDISRS